MVLDTKPPLELGVEIETAEGATFTLSADEIKASDVPMGLTFATQRGEGFSTATFTLAREIFRDYPDLNLLDTVRFIGRQGDIAYEGRIQSFPRTNDPTQTITVQCVGWMTYLKGRPMAALICDRRLGGWSDVSMQRKAQLVTTPSPPASGPWRFEGSIATGWQYTGALGPAVVITFTNYDTKFSEIGEAWLYAGGEDIGQIKFNFARLQGSATETNFHSSGYLSNDDQASGYDISPDAHSANTENVVCAATVPGRKFAALQVWYGGTFAGTEQSDFAFLYPRIIGTHGLNPIGASPEEGYGLTDVIRYLLATYRPKIQWAGEENQFPLLQATWHDNPTDPYSAITQLNNYVLWEMNVWEERKFYFEPADLTKADWQIRTSDPGVKVNFQGDSIENFASGVIITYEDFFGHTYTLYPGQHPELRDQNENNPATRHGEDLFISYTIPGKCLEREALSFGSAYLAENNRPKRPGSFTVQGHIKDEGGHWRQAWKPRNSETLAVMDDLYEGEPRLITATSYDEDSNSTTITVDAPPQKIEAMVARQQLALDARNLTSR